MIKQFYILASAPLLLSLTGGAAHAQEATATSPYQDKIHEALRPSAGGLSADKAAASARESAPSVAVADAEVEKRITQASRTLSRYIPNLSINAGVTRKNPVNYDFTGGAFSVGALNEGILGVGTCPDGSQGCVVDAQGTPVAAVAAAAFEIPQNTYNIDATLSVPFSDYVLALSRARKGANATQAAARLNRDAELATVDVNARIAFYDWARAKAQHAIAVQNLVSSEAQLEDARIGLDAGTITSADALAIESVAAGSRVAVAQSESFVRLAEQNLRITTQYQGAMVLGEDLRAPIVDASSLGSLDQLIAKAVRDRAEIRALGKSIQAMGHGAKGAEVGLYPRLDGVANITHANPNQAFFPPGPEWNTSWYVGVNLSWRLDGYLNTRASVRELKADRGVLVAQQRAMIRAIEFEVRAAWEAFERAKAAEAISATELVAAEANYDQRMTLFRGGEATSTDVVQADIQRANAIFRKVGAAIDKRVALARLRRAAGIPFDEGQVHERR